jgi:hypothetical protein
VPGAQRIALVIALLLPAHVFAQTPVTLKIETAFFGDNTEFFNPFRAGETILGAYQRIFLTLQPSERAELRLGVFASELAGSHSPFERVLPIVALHLGTPRHRLILGTLETAQRRDGLGPDRTTPHGLIPALQVETLSFLRPYEAGVQWLTDTPTVRQDVWFHYQKRNTPEHRERFDGGLVGRIGVRAPFSVGYQVHVVHEGGQQFRNGPVSDSVAYGPGLIVEQPKVGPFDRVSLELYGIWSFSRPDRGSADRIVTGEGLFVRAAGERRDWRGHLIVWRGCDVDHEEGDPNYLSRRKDGTLYRGTRDYAEFGVTRLFRTGASVDFESSFRLHRIESELDYSYRLLGIVKLGYRLR